MQEARCKQVKQCLGEGLQSRTVKRQWYGALVQVCAQMQGG